MNLYPPSTGRSMEEAVMMIHDHPHVMESPEMQELMRRDLVDMLATHQIQKEAYDYFIALLNGTEALPPR